jgi:hypothetical protein
LRCPTCVPDLSVRIELRETLDDRRKRWITDDRTSLSRCRAIAPWDNAIDERAHSPKGRSLSVLNDLRGLEQRVLARLAELRPLIEEYEELQRVAERLGVDPSAAPSRSSRPPAKSTRASRRAKPTRRRPAKRAPRRQAGSSSRRRPGGTRATGAERRARVLSLIKQQPGISVPEIAKDIGVEPPPLYRVVRKLQEEGVIVKEGKSLRLV